MSNAATRAESRIQKIEGGITAPAGFKAAGVYAGIKPPTHAWPLDVMVMTADSPVSAAAVFTTNKTQAAPVIVSRAISRSLADARSHRVQQRMRHACTGDAGMDVARSTLEFVASKVGCKLKNARSSTGVIVVDLNLQKVQDGITKACRAEPRRAPQRDAREHDDRSVSKGSRGQG